MQGLIVTLRTGAFTGALLALIAGVLLPVIAQVASTRGITDLASGISVVGLQAGGLYLLILSVALFQFFVATREFVSRPKK